MSIVAIVQARMGSKRLPGKSMADLAGHPLLWQFLERVKKAERPDTLVMATTEAAEDDVLRDVAQRCGVRVFRGSANDLVDRYYQTAKVFGATLVVRLCADNPVAEPREIDRIIDFHRLAESDFSANTHNIQDNGYPDGLGAEVFDFSLLEELWRVTQGPTNREHVHSYVYDNPDKYHIRTIPCPAEFARPELKLDVNTPRELAFVRAIYEYWYPKKKNFHITDIISWYDNIYHPV